MADKKYSAEYNITGNAAEALREIEQSAKGAGDKIEESGKKTKDAATETTSFSDRLNKLKVAYELVAKQAAEAVKVFAQQEASAGRLKNAFKQAGLGANELAKANQILINNRDTLGLGLVEQRDALRQLVEVTGDAEMATRDLALAIDIQSQENISLEQATEVLRKARNGEVEELKNLNGITKEQSEALNKMEGDAARGAEAIDRLRESYEGAAEANAGTAEKLAAYQEQLVDVQSSLGEFIVASTRAAGAIADIGNESDTTSINLRNFSRGLDDFAGQATEAAGEIEKFTEEITAAEIALFIAAGPEGLGRWIQVLDRAETKIAQTTAAQENLNKALDPAILSGSSRTRTTPGVEGPRGIFEAVSEEELQKEEERKEKVRAEARRKAKEKQRKQEAALDDLMGKVDAAQMAGEEAVAEERKQEALQKQYELRERIAELRLEGKDLEAEFLEITNSQLTPTEQLVELNRELLEYNERRRDVAEDTADDEEDAAKAAKRQRVAIVEASGQAATGIISMISQSDEAKRASAALDAAIYGYKAIEAFIASNYAAGIGYTTAAAQAAAIAGGAGGGSSGTGGGAKGAGQSNAAQNRSQPDAEAQARRNARLFAEELQREQESRQNVYNINYRSLDRPEERDARLLGEALSRDAQTQVGGAGRTLNVGGG